MWKHAPLILALSTSWAAAEAKLFSGSENVQHYGEPAINGKLTLTPFNGFFDKGHFKATGTSPSPEAEKQWIGSQFETLIPIKLGGSAYWHIWFDKPGETTLSLDGTGQWTARLGTQSTRITPGKTISIQATAAGKQVLSLTPKSEPDSSSISRITFNSPGTKLLRARWRPAAAHNRYHSSTAKNPTIWVFESQSVGQGSHYSPMTTNFGYFGATFSADNQAAGGVNFSMWAASQNAEKLPPLKTMPHLLATGNPDADFSGFGHEGSGVKIRNWEPYAHHPKSVIQALRMEVNEEFETYFGYLYDDRSHHWQLYAVGRRPLKNGKIPELKATSFCEVPGPPQVERTGDLIRKIRRRGWFYGDDKKWHQADTSTFTSRKEVINKLNTIDHDGWFILGTGGLDFITPNPIAKTNTTFPTPDYLQPEKAAQLFALPVTYQRRKAVAQKTSAKVSYRIAPLKDATATLHFGTTDCLTFVKRDLHGTEKKGLSSKLYSDDRVWQQKSPPMNFSGDTVSFNLSDLEPDTTYHARVLISHLGGKSWDFESISFTTEK
ncbi:MAG: DUF3472 domain-containing protein [Verrucomicrobiaceae bacterium]